MEFKLYTDQSNTVDEAVEILGTSNWVYLALECQIGKTLISLAIAEALKSKSVLVVTLKTVVTGRGFEDDYTLQGNTFDMTTINYESAHKVQDLEFDTLIIDEGHSIGAFPKMTKRAKVMKDLKKKAKKVIFLSATPTPESYSQWFHQLFGIDGNVTSQYTTFYKFAKDWVNVKVVRVAAQREVNDYSDCKEEFNDLLQSNILSMTYDYAMFVRWVHRELPEAVAKLRYGRKFQIADIGKPFRLNDKESYTAWVTGIKQSEGGETLKESKVEDCFIDVDTSNEVAQGPFVIFKRVKVSGTDDYEIKEVEEETLPLFRIERILDRDKCIMVRGELVTIESGASMLSKASQLSSGVLIDDERNTHILSDLKVRAALENFDESKRLAIFYFFIGEKNLIKETLGDDVTDNLADFQSGKAKHFMVHFRTGKAGIRLAQADELVMFNVPHSFEQWYQARQRRSALLKEGKELKVWWAMSSHGIEHRIFDVVEAKKDYTLKHYEKQKEAVN